VAAGQGARLEERLRERVNGNPAAAEAKPSTRPE
jgi:hypothetical protein